MRKLRAVLKQQLLSTLRYRGSVLNPVVTILAELAGFYFLAKAIGPQFRPEGVDYFSFVLIGSAYFGFLVSGVSIFVASVRESQLTGTMEVLMTTSTPPVTVICMHAFSEFSTRTLQMLAYLIAGFALFGGAGSGSASVSAFLLVFALSIVLAICIGLIAAAFQVWIQRGSLVVWGLGSVGWLLTGTMFPVEVLPSGLQQVAQLLPVTHALTAMRQSLLAGTGISELLPHLAVLGIWVAALLPMSLVALKQALRTARREGTLSLY
jgi:ABC-2 type transport system permease protein